MAKDKTEQLTQVVGNALALFGIITLPLIAGFAIYMTLKKKE
jgi:hypothetical protein